MKCFYCGHEGNDVHTYPLGGIIRAVCDDLRACSHRMTQKVKVEALKETHAK